MVGNAPDEGADEVCGAELVMVVMGAAVAPPADDDEAPVLVCEPHGVMVVVLHEAVSRFLIRPHSLVSMLSFQWALMATQSAR